MAKLETDVESLLKFAKVGEFKYRPFAKSDEAEAGEMNAPQIAPEPVQPPRVAKPIDVATVDRARFVEPNSAPQSAKTSLSEKFAVLASQPTKVSGRLILKKHSFAKRALPSLQNSMIADPKDKPLIAVFLRLDSENVGGKKRLYLTK
ncbi:MAG: hypothetical protein V4607_08690 [Pseudomonadota bacterium]